MKKSLFVISCLLGLSGVSFADDTVMVASIIPTLSSEEVSIPLTYSAAFCLGYDSNIKGTQSMWGGKKYSSAYVRPNVMAEYADYSNARTKTKFTLDLGAYYYMKTVPGTKQWYSNSSLTYFMSHSINSRLSLTTSNRISYRLEPDYAMGLSSSLANGNYWTISTSDSLNYKWSSRFSSSTTGGFSWIKYDEFDYENRALYNIGETFFYALTSRLTWNLRYTYQKVDREQGLDSQSNYFSTGGSYAISSLSSVNFNFGLQMKSVGSKLVGDKVYPTFDLGYNQRLTEKWHVTLFSRLSNEDMGTYWGPNANYGSNMTLRAGFNTSYVVTPAWTTSLGIDEVFSQYTQATGQGMADRDQNTTCISWTNNYKISESWRASLNLSYTLGSVDYKKIYMNGNYNRYNVSTQVTYKF